MKKSLIYSSVIAFLYVILWWWFASPYRLIPADDQAFLLGTLFFHHPAFSAFLKVVDVLSSPFLDHKASILLLQALVWNGLSVLLIGVFVYRMTKSLFFGVVGSLLFGVSAWPAMYLFFGSYAPMAGFLVLCSCWCLTEGYLSQDRPLVFVFLAGVLAGLGIMTSLSTVFIILLQLGAIFLLYAPWENRERWKPFIYYLVPVLVQAALFLAFCGSRLNQHLKEKLSTIQFSEALASMGHIPNVPFPSFIFISHYYVPVLLYGALAMFLLYIMFFFDLKRRRTGVERLLFVFIGIALIYPFAVDLSPSLKVGRIHFAIYPLLIVLVVSLVWYWLGKFSKSKPFWVLVCVVGTGWTCFDNIQISRELVRVKQRGVEYVERIRLGNRFFVFKKDIHADPLERWLDTPLVRINSLEEIQPGDSKGAVLVIGPHGRSSGKSFHRQSTFDDYDLMVSRPERVRETTIPYFAYFPPFLIEGGVSGAFYLSGRSPSYNQKRLQVTLWKWDKVSSARSN